MGAHRRPKSPGRARITTLSFAAGAFTLLSAQSGQAQPKQTVEEVRAEVEKLYEEATGPTEEYNTARERQQKLQKEADKAQDEAARQQQEINELRDRIGPLAAEQYRNGGIDPSVQLALSADPDEYLKEAEMADRVGHRQASALSVLQDKQRELAQQRKETSAKLREAEDFRKAAAEKKDEVQKKLTEARTLLNSLTAEERQRLDAAEEQEAEEAGTSDSADTYDGPASGRAKAALDFAYAQLGKPYEWGATGPDSFDCSGLTGAAWGAAGVSLPRTVKQQYDAGRKVSQADMQPGDIIYWYNDTQHNGMYVGDGQAIHAPRTGKNVEITPVDSMPFYAASRP